MSTSNTASSCASTDASLGTSLYEAGQIEITLDIERIHRENNEGWSLWSLRPNSYALEKQSVEGTSNAVQRVLLKGFLFVFNLTLVDGSGCKSDVGDRISIRYEARVSSQNEVIIDRQKQHIFTLGMGNVLRL